MNYETTTCFTDHCDWLVIYANNARVRRATPGEISQSNAAAAFDNGVGAFPAVLTSEEIEAANRVATADE